jgi:sigma-E factor negative regulatory protein RseA
MQPAPHPPREEPPPEDPRRWLSALMDGEAQALPLACQQWREDASARQTWHAYQLIGDVLRSEDLARPAARDAAFLAGLRERLAAEPVALAPQASAPAAARRRVAWVPATMVAGFVAVAGVLVVLRAGAPGTVPGRAELAAASAPTTALRGGSGAVLRNPELDEYLRAHQAARGSVALVAPGGTLRQVDVLVSAGSGQ